MNYINHLLSSASISIFSLQISNFHYIRKYRYTSNLNTWFLILFTFFESIKVFLINMFAVLMTSAKMATLGLLKENFFWSKVMKSKSLPKTSPTKLYHVTQIILLMWSFDQVCSNVVKFAKYSISMTEVIITSILEGFDQKKQFFWGVFLVQIQ